MAEIPADQSTSESQDLPDKNPQDTFRKLPGSSPAQVRSQYLQHMMTSGPSQPKKPSPNHKLRPTKDVLNRLQYDPNYNLADYAIGYIGDTRQAGIIELGVQAWVDEGWAMRVPEDRIAYFKFLPDGELVWDRVGKADRVFNVRE